MTSRGGHPNWGFGGEETGQQALAQSLVSSLGYAGAVQACQANAWDGILKHVLAHEKTGKPIGE
ncbi:MAG: hypothetical protein V3T80_04885 [Kiloniellales bacterium]